MTYAAIPAVLSVRLPSPSRDRLKAAAAARGETVQGLVGALVERFLAEDGRRAPELAQALGALRAGAAGLRARGVRRLWVAGAVARGCAAPGAAVEVLCEFEPGARVSLVGLASLRAELGALLGAPAALAERAALPPGPARDQAERYAVRVL
jgi:predicted nucleotidyltransferase